MFSEVLYVTMWSFYICIHICFLAPVESLFCKPKYRANIFNCLFFYFISVSISSPCHKDQFAVFTFYFIWCLTILLAVVSVFRLLSFRPGYTVQPFLTTLRTTRVFRGCHTMQFVASNVAIVELNSTSRSATA